MAKSYIQRQTNPFCPFSGTIWRLHRQKTDAAEAHAERVLSWLTEKPSKVHCGRGRKQKDQQRRRVCRRRCGDRGRHGNPCHGSRPGGSQGDSWVFDEDFIVGLDLCRKMLIASVIVIPKLENIFSALNFISGSMRILMFALLAILFIAFKAKFLWLIMQRIPHPIQITDQKNPKQKQIMSNHRSEEHTSELQSPDRT